MAYIEKLNSKGNITMTYLIQSKMSCGDNYHSGKNHRFCGSKEQAELLNFIFKALRADVSEIFKERNTFKFNFHHDISRIHRQLFKICRYVRNKDTYEILKTMKKAIEAGVKPYNAIVLGHYCRNSFYNWSGSMDLFGRGIFSRARHGYTSWEKWKQKGIKSPTIYINNYYPKISDPNKCTELEKLVQAGEFIEAQRLILKGRWTRRKKKTV